jgi:hypothetical protein
VKDRPRFLSGTRVLVAAVTLFGILVWMLIQGATLFSPGGLNAQAKTKTLGGVATHAQLGANCGACHAAPWSSRTMDDRCVACHKDVATQMQGNNGIHGGLVGAMSSPACRVCHSEHRGPNGALTANFNHNALPFKLTGAHVNVPCQQCHTAARSTQGLANTPQDCYSCHANVDKHNGTFGTDCGQCHSTTSWANATFDHTIFPIDHGTNQQASTCKTCHPTDFSTYTCLGCHFHTPASVQSDHEGKSLASLTDCIRCHPGGRSAGGG